MRRVAITRLGVAALSMIAVSVLIFAGYNLREIHDTGAEFRTPSSSGSTPDEIVLPGHASQTENYSESGRAPGNKGSSDSGSTLHKDYIPLRPQSSWCRAVSVPRNRNLSRRAQDGSEIIYNGIKLPRTWPPPERSIRDLFENGMPEPPYLKHPPRTISVDVGRQIFVDSFLVEAEENIVRVKNSFSVDRDAIFELRDGKARMLTDGAWYDGETDQVRLYYRCQSSNSRSRTCVALSTDGGKTWKHPDLKNRNPLSRKHHGSSRRLGKGSCAVHCGEGVDQSREFSTVTLNDDATHASGRWVVGFENHKYSDRRTYPLWVLESHDGLGDWVRRPSPARVYRSHTCHSYNPFRKKWIWIIRQNTCFEVYISRFKRYAEGDSLSTPFKFWMNLDGPIVPGYKGIMTCPAWRKGEPVVWMGADSDVDTFQGSGWRQSLPKGGGTEANLKFLARQTVDRPPDLYAMTMSAYESVSIAVLDIWDGKRGVPRRKKMTVAMEFSRDGFHFPVSNPRHVLFQPPDDCIYDILGSGNFIIVGDEIHVYWICVSVKNLSRTRMHRARLRRDGFVGLIAAPKSRGVLMTKNLSSCGTHLFVNVDLGASGTFAVAVVPSSGDSHASDDGESSLISDIAAIDGASEDDMDRLPEGLSSTKVAITWRGGHKSIPPKATEGFRLRFTLSGTAVLYSFWLAQDERGASLGFLGGGEVGKKRMVDV